MSVLLSDELSEGQALSVGERQRLALARAMFREARLLILDEPSSALDPFAEAKLIDSFRDLLGGERSALLISHRMSTVRLADRIYVMEHGRMVEQGSHAELMAKGGLYRRMYGLQAEHYLD